MKSTIDLYVIDKVKEMRRAHNWTQVDLALELGTSTGFIGQAESHKSPTKYNIQHINRLAKIFNCSPREFLPLEPI